MLRPICLLGWLALTAGAAEPSTYYLSSHGGRADGSERQALYGEDLPRAFDRVYDLVAKRRAAGDNTPVEVVFPAGPELFVGRPLWWDLPFTTFRGAGPGARLQASWFHGGPIFIHGFARHLAGPFGDAGRPKVGSRYAVRTSPDRAVFFLDSPPTALPDLWREVRTFTAQIKLREPDGAPLRPGPLLGAYDAAQDFRAEPWECFVDRDGAIVVRFSTTDGKPALTGYQDGAVGDRTFRFRADPAKDGTYDLAFTIDLANAAVAAWSGGRALAVDTTGLKAGFDAARDLRFVPGETTVFALGACSTYGATARPDPWRPWMAPAVAREFRGLHLHTGSAPLAGSDAAVYFTPTPATIALLPLDDPPTGPDAGRTVAVLGSGPRRGLGLLYDPDTRPAFFVQHGLRWQGLTVRAWTGATGSALLMTGMQDPRFEDCGFFGGWRGVAEHVTAGGTYTYKFLHCRFGDSNDASLYLQKCIARIEDFHGGYPGRHWLRADDANVTLEDGFIAGAGPGTETIVKKTAYDYGGSLVIRDVLQDSEGDGGPTEAVVAVYPFPAIREDLEIDGLGVGSTGPHAAVVRLYGGPPGSRARLHQVRRTAAWAAPVVLWLGGPEWTGRYEPDDFGGVPAMEVAPGVVSRLLVAANKFVVADAVRVERVGDVNRPPTVAALTVAPDSVTAGDCITLSAGGVADPDGGLARVEFYREADGVPGLLPGSDTLVATDADGSDGWSATIATSDAGPGVRAYYALAADNRGLTSPTELAAATVEVAVRGIDVRAHGAVGDGIVDDKAAIESAIRAAVQSGVGVVYLPAGTYRVALSRTTPGLTDQIRVPGNVRIVGAGRDLTTVRFDPASNDFAWSGLRVAAEFTLEIADVTLRGPDVGVNVESKLIHREGPQTGVAYDAAVRLRRVNLAGEMSSAIWGDSGTLSPWTGRLGLELEDCDVTGWIQAVSWYCGYTSADALHYLHASRTRFHDAGLTAQESPTGVALGHLVYVHPNTSLDIRDCAFDNNPRWAIHWYGQSPVGAPQYARILRNTFGPGINTAILTTDRIGTTTLVEDCTFRNAGTAIQTRSAVTARNCTFAQGGDVLSSLGAYANADERAATVVLIEDSTIEGGAIVQPFPENDSSVTVRRCTFRGNSRVVNNGSGSAVLEVIDCIDEATNSTWVQAYSGRVTVRGCTIRGRHIAGAISFISPLEHLTVEGNVFHGLDTLTGTNRAFHTYSTVPLDVAIISGSGNTYRAAGWSQQYWNEKNGLVGGIPIGLWQE